MQKFRFYYDQLRLDDQRMLYIELEAAVLAMIDTVRVHMTPWLQQTGVPSAVMQILECVYGDNPELYYVKIWCGDCRPIGYEQVEVMLAYRLSTAEQIVCAARMEAAVQDILARLFPKGWEDLSQIRREKAIFDEIVDHVVYWHEAVERCGNVFREKNPMAWTSYGALVEHRAVCHGIAAAFKLLCDKVDLPCILVLGMAGERHAWNIVSIGHRFFHVDCTWDLRTQINRQIPYMRYRYLNLPDRMMLADRSVECEFLPACKSLRYNPFAMRGMCIQDADSLLPMAAERIAAREERFAFLLDCEQHCIPTRNEVAHLLRLMTGKCVSVYRDPFYIGFVQG